jgi:hypothetical protein
MAHCTNPKPSRKSRAFRTSLIRTPLRGLALPFLLLAGCTAKPDPLVHVPDFARKPFAPFSATEAIAIAMREWRAWGQLVDDDPPGSRPPVPAEFKPERTAGMWQRVGEYWWLGQDANRPESAWTGRTDAFGVVFAAGDDGSFAWSAAFISYVMRTAGAGARFPYSQSHATYINAARQMSLGTATGWALWAEPALAAAPRPGDLICAGRANAHDMAFEDLPAGNFPSHCDLVVSSDGAALTVIGGNVDDAVTMKHVPLTLDGRIIDPRYPWFVVIRVQYDVPTALGSALAPG